MKSALLLALLTLATHATHAGAAPSKPVPANPVSVSARAQIDSDLRDIKGSSERVHNQKVSLAITLTGRAAAPENRTIKWYVFGRNVKSNQVTIIGSGDATLRLGEFGRQSLETKAVSSTYTPDHSVVERDTKGGKAKKGDKPKTRVRRVAGSGVKYIGYGVVVKEGNNTVGKVFMSPGLEAEVK